MRKFIPYVGAVALIVAALVLEPNIHIHRVGAAPTQAMQTSLNGVQNQMAAVAGTIPIYDLSGTLITNAKCFQGQVTSAATTGQWSAPNSPGSLGLTAISSVSATVLSPGGSLTNLTGQYGVSLQNATTAAINGTVTSPVTIVLGGISIGFGPSAATVFIRFCGPS